MMKKQQSHSRQCFREELTAVMRALEAAVTDLHLRQVLAVIFALSLVSATAPRQHPHSGIYITVRSYIVV